MNRVLIFLVAILLGVSAASAQKSDYGDVRRFEGELGVGFATAGKAGGIKVTPGMALFLEGRYNIDNTPFDVGLQILFTNYARDGVMIDGERYDMHIMPRPFIVYGDYNFRRWKRVSFFGGLGLGYAQVVNQSSPEGTWRLGTGMRYNYFAASPRVGAEFFHRVRLTVDYKIIPDKYSFFGANLGFVFGGGIRK